MAFWRSRSPADRLRMTSRGTAVRTPRHLTPETVRSSIKLAALHPISWLFMFELFTLSMTQISKRMNALFWNIYLYMGSNYRWQPCNAAALAKERSWMVPYHSDVCGSCAIVSGLYAPGSFLAWLSTMLTVLHKQQMTVLQNQNAPSSGQPTPTPASDAKRLLDPAIGGLIYSIASSIDLILRTISKDTKAPLISANKVTCLSLLFATYRMYLEAYVSSSSGSLSDSRRLPQRQRQSLELRLWEVAFICSSLVLFIHGLISKIRGQVPAWLALQFLWAVLCIYIFLQCRPKRRRPGSLNRLNAAVIALPFLHLLDQQGTASNCAVHEFRWDSDCVFREFRDSVECRSMAWSKWACQDIRYGFFPCSNSTLGEMDQLATLGVVVITLWALPLLRLARKWRAAERDEEGEMAVLSS